MEFYSKNKFEKLVHLVGFIIRVYILIRVTQSLLPHKLSLQLVNSRHHTAATAPLRLNYDPPSWFHTIPPVGSLRSPGWFLTIAQLVRYDPPVGSFRSLGWFLTIPPVGSLRPPSWFLTIAQLIPYDPPVGSLWWHSWFLTMAQLVPYDPPGRFLTIPQLVPYDRLVGSLRSPQLVPLKCCGVQPSVPRILNVSADSASHWIMGTYRSVYCVVADSQHEFFFYFLLIYLLRGWRRQPHARTRDV